MNRFCLVLFLTAAVLPGQTKNPSDAWLMQNYRFARPPAPGEIKPVGPSVGQLQEIQNTLLSILRKSNFDYDYEAALAAAAQAAANAQLIGLLTGEIRVTPPPQMSRPAAEEEKKTDDPIYLIALVDGSIEAATTVWLDRLMLHYRTPAGVHEQVRLDRVNWRLSDELNGKRKADGPVRLVREGLSQ
jgi:hypothetical protein